MIIESIKNGLTVYSYFNVTS